MLDPMLITVAISALVAALNPYTLGVLVLLVSVIYGGGHPPRRVLGLGLVYIITLFLAAFFGGMALLYLFTLLPLIAADYLALGIGILIVSGGLLEIKDFFWYGQGLSLRTPLVVAKGIRSLTRQRPGLWSAAALGLFVAVMISPGSSAPYFATITLLRSSFDTRAINLLGLYCGIFVLPMIILLALVLGGVRVSTIQRWKEDAKGRMHLGMGLLLIALGWTIILIGSGVLNLG
jgi:hypothetical protein